MLHVLYIHVHVFMYVIDILNAVVESYPIIPVVADNSTINKTTSLRFLVKESNSEWPHKSWQRV